MTDEVNAARVVTKDTGPGGPPAREPPKTNDVAGYKVIPVLVGCFPLGLYLVWTSRHFSKAARLPLTIATVALSPMLAILAVPVGLAAAAQMAFPLAAREPMGETTSG